MTEYREDFLKRLGADDELLRSKLIEDLRQAADRIEATAIIEPNGWKAGAEVQPYRVALHFELAKRLRDVAASLCDHTRLVDGLHCRYCDAVIG